MLSDAKIVNLENLRIYKFINRICFFLSIALVLNSLGLLISKYVSLIGGILFFALLLIILAYFSVIALAKKQGIYKFINETFSFILIFLFGLLPALGIITF
ncbi:MAG: hypothetical protein QW041_01600 [Candidatus Pacearchaeota archaeon]